MSARTVSTIEELDALPVRTLVVDGAEECWRKLASGRWDCLDTNGEDPAEESGTLLWQAMDGPRALVVWEPTPMHLGSEEDR